MPAGRVDPYRSYSFLVEIDGLTHAGFQECTGLDESTETVEYREGSDPNHVRKLPGLGRYTNITLRRGVTDSDELWKWRTTVRNGREERRNGSIVLLDLTGREVRRWNFFNAFPSRWTGPAFNATANAVAIEALEITYEDMQQA
jgi:phage tail-like protein